MAPLLTSNMSAHPPVENPQPRSGVTTSLPVPSSWTQEPPPAKPQGVPIVLDPSSPEPEAKEQSVARALDSNRIPQTTDIGADLLNRFGYDPNHNTDNEKFSVAKAGLIIKNIKEYAQSLPGAAESSALVAPNTGGRLRPRRRARRANPPPKSPSCQKRSSG